MALSRGVPPRPQAFATQADAQPFAALLDAAVSPAPGPGQGAPAAPAQSIQQKPAADTGGAAQDDAGSSAPGASAGNAAQGSTGNGAPAESANAGTTNGAATPGANDGKSVPASDANNPAALASAASGNGISVQSGNPDGTHQPAAKNGGDHKPGAAANTNEPAITMPPALPGGDGNAKAPSGNGASATGNGAVPSANDPASDAADAGKNASDNTEAAAAAAAAVDAGGSASPGVAAPVASKPSGGNKDDSKDQNSGAADAAAGSPAGQAQLPSPDSTQPVAAALVVNAAPDSTPAAATKPGLAIADAVKTRAKVALTSAATGQGAPAQDDSADATDSSSALDQGGANASPVSSGSSDSGGDASVITAQQGFDQPQSSGANGAALLSPIDFASLGGTQHFGARGDAAGSLSGTTASAAPNGTTNAAFAPNFGVFAPGAIATNTTAPAAAASEPAVPLAGLAVAIAGRAQAGSSQFDIRLDPPELGRIDVRLDVDGSGQVRTHVTADRADTLQLLQSQQPQLERALEQAGLKTADNGLQFTLRDQSFAGQNGGSSGQQQATPATPLVIPEADIAPIDTTQIYARLRYANGLDIRV